MGKMKDMLLDMHETIVTIECPECQGSGYVDHEVPRPHGPDRDVGVIDVWTEVCETCEGDGEIEQLCERCEEPVTKVRCDADGHYVINPLGYTLCEECSS
jgi:RecJ-like exonuclease